ncbi:MAG: tetratricopeptide repeat protein [Verrucomicrobia bacterium]|nr:tetratricopeptide repeat protein [Verrucomicrobiota bacterium]
MAAQITDTTSAAPTNAPPEQVEQVQLDLGNGFLNREFYHLAMAEYQKLIEWFPNGLSVEEARYRIGDCHRGLANLDAAREQYETLQRDFPKGVFFARAAFRLGEIAWNAERYPEALKKFSEAAETAESQETRLTGRFYQARALIQLKKNQEAIPVLQDLARVEKQNPYRGFALLELGRILEASGQEDEARVLFAKTLDTDTSPILRAEGGVKSGVLAMKARQWKEAVADFEKVRMLNAGEEWMLMATVNLVRALYQSDQYEAVIRTLEDPKNRFPKETQAETSLLHAHAYRLLKKCREAVRHYDIFLKNHPDHPSRESAAYERLICLYVIGMDSWDAEAAAFLKAHPKAERARQVLYLQADRAFQRKDYRSAAALYAAIAGAAGRPLDPALEPEIIYRQAFSLAQTGRHSEAATGFADFVKRFPNHALAPTALFQEGLAEEAAGKLEAALASFRGIVGRFPKATERESALYRSALMLGELKQYPAMRDAFQQLAREYPKNPFVDDAAYWTGWSLFEEKKYADALPYLLQARKAKPDDYGAQAASRILLAEYHLRQRAALLKEVEARPADATPLATEIHQWLAAESVKDGDHAAAERQFRKLIAHPGAVEWRQSARWGLASSLAAQSKWKEAAETWEAYQKDYPNPNETITAKLELIRAYTALKEFVHAQEIAEDVLQIQPEGRNNAQARFLLGELMCEQKKHAEAGKYFLSVAVLYDDPEMTPRSLARAIQSFEAAGETNQVAKLKEELKTKHPNFK